MVSSFPEFEKKTSRIFESVPKFLVIQLYGIKESGNFEFRESIVFDMDVAIESSFGFCFIGFSGLSTDCLDVCSRSCWSLFSSGPGRRRSTVDHGEGDRWRRSIFAWGVVVSNDFLTFDTTFSNLVGG